MPELRKSRIEIKSDATTQAARSIIQGEAADRKAKTAKLRAARLALEAIILAAKRKPKGN